MSRKDHYRSSINVGGSDTIDEFVFRHPNTQAAADRIEVMLENWIEFDNIRMANAGNTLFDAEKRLARAGKLLRQATVYLCSVGPHEGIRRSGAQNDVVARAKLYDAAAARVDGLKVEIECGYAPAQRRYLGS